MTGSSLCSVRRRFHLRKRDRRHRCRIPRNHRGRFRNPLFHRIPGFRSLKHPYLPCRRWPLPLQWQISDLHYSDRFPLWLGQHGHRSSTTFQKEALPLHRRRLPLIRLRSMFHQPGRSIGEYSFPHHHRVCSTRLPHPTASASTESLP